MKHIPEHKSWIFCFVRLVIDVYFSSLVASVQK